MAINQIKYKIGLIIFTTFACGLAALMFLTQWSFKNQFLSYTSQRISDSLLPLDDTIARTYLKDGNLDHFRGSPEAWRRITHRLIRKNIRRARIAGGGQLNQAGTSGDINRSSSWEQSLRQNQRMFLNNLGLYDLDKNRIAGTRKTIESQKFHGVFADDKIIAYLGYTEPREFTRGSEFIFWNQLVKSFWVIISIMLLVSIVAASLLARKISNPLQKLSRATRRLAQGEKIEPIESTSNDEIGQLCQSFNSMSQQLAESESVRKRWVADISHELRTPLSVLKAQLMALEDGVRPANKENLSLLTEKINSINYLINDLYELSLFDSKALTYDKTFFSLSDYLNDFISLHRDEFKDEGLDFNMQILRNNKDIIYADEKRIGQLMMNTIQNSIRYTDKPGKVLWKVTKNRDKVVLSMSDSSPGLSEEKLKLIFDRLYRADVSRNQKTGGTGLGLSICKSIVEAHEGRIWAKASELNGVEIIAEFPLLKTN